jgi:hypothetical protein
MAAEVGNREARAEAGQRPLSMADMPEGPPSGSRADSEAPRSGFKAEPPEGPQPGINAEPPEGAQPSLKPELPEGPRAGF